MESSQTAADLKLHLDKYHAQLKEAQLVVADKSMALQQQSFKYKRIQVSRAIFYRLLTIPPLKLVWNSCLKLCKAVSGSSVCILAILSFGITHLISPFQKNVKIV